jgi:hypothetical protein
MQSLRLSYGAVKGYMEGGKQVAPYTTIGGFYDRSKQFGEKFPYNLPPRWAAKKPVLKLDTPYNFVSTNDIIGGNAGSPTVNKDGELVGLIFDGNRQSLVGNFYYDESVNRAISVDSRGMLEVLRKVYEVNEVVDELARPAAPAESSHNGEPHIGRAPKRVLSQVRRAASRLQNPNTRADANHNPAGEINEYHEMPPLRRRQLVEHRSLRALRRAAARWR